MGDKKLLDDLTRLGLPMFEPAADLDVNATLAEVVKSKDTRLWEGFPVLLANAASKFEFFPERVEGKLHGKKEREVFRHLQLMSMSLYDYHHLKFTWTSQLKKRLSENEKSLVQSWKKNLARDQNLAWDDVRLDAQRLKNMFELYFERSAEKSRSRLGRYEEFSLEYALSQVFSPKQKELFRKKLEGLPLTKTEKEYFSRTVKKKVVALANADLHGMARRLLER